MKEKGRSRALHKKPYGLCKRFLAAMIAAVMVTTNIGTDLTTAYAAESSDSVTFEMSGSGLVTAIEEAIAAGSPLQEGDIDFTNGKTEQFEALFYGEGNIYEIYPEYDGLYRHQNQYLYVSRGQGYLGFPGRIGLRPVITEFILHPNR